MFHHDVGGIARHVLCSQGCDGLRFCHRDCYSLNCNLTERDVRLYGCFPSDGTALAHDKAYEISLRWLFIIVAGKITCVINMSQYEWYCGSEGCECVCESVSQSHIYATIHDRRPCRKRLAFFFSPPLRGLVCELPLCALACVIFSCCAGVAVWELTGTLPPLCYTLTRALTPPTQSLFKFGNNVRLGWFIKTEQLRWMYIHTCCLCVSNESAVLCKSVKSLMMWCRGYAFLLFFFF